MVDHSEEINLLDYWNVLWRRKMMLIALFAVSVLATMVISLQLPKFYKSETVIMSSTSESGGLGAALSSLPFAGALTGAAGIQTPADKIMVILKSRTVAEAVIRKFDLLRIFNETKWDPIKGTWKDLKKPPLLVDAFDTLTKNVTKISKSKEGFITISVEWKDPQLAADMANYYVAALTTILNEKSINITIQVVDKAVPAERKSRPSIRQNMMLAGVLSCFIGIFLAFFLEYLSKQKKN
jgi:polysaccharide biosynthesis transport protein